MRVPGLQRDQDQNLYLVWFLCLHLSVLDSRFSPTFSQAWILQSTSSRWGGPFLAPTFSAAAPRISTASSSLSVFRSVHP